MLALKIIGGIAIGLVIALSFGYVFLYLLSKSLDWLDRHYGITIRRLLNKPLPESSNDSGHERKEAEYLIYSHYISQNARRVLKWVSNISYIHTHRPNQNCEKKCAETRPKCFVQRRPFPSWCSFPQWHIGTIVKRLRGRVNQSGKEPYSRRPHS